MFEMLPSRPTLDITEALDCYLERLAQANELSSSTLYKLLLQRLDADRTAMGFFMVSPHPAVIRTISGLSGVDHGALRAATLLRYDGGLPLRLDGLDPTWHNTFRRIATQGWFPRYGSQACPMCLADTGIWQLEWRLPIVAVCRTHEVYLLTRCASCRQRFRVRRKNPMRPHLSPQQRCGNPIGHRPHCEWPIVAGQPEPATPPAITAAGTIALALAGRPVTMLGHAVDPQIYLAELRNVATLLLHILTVTGQLGIATLAAGRSGRRWGISPPPSSSTRGRALAGAHAILGKPTPAEAGTHLAAWLPPTTQMTNGPYNWMINRTAHSDTIEQLISAALASHRHVAGRLTSIRSRRPLAVCAIPQMIDQDVYFENFDGLLGSYPWIGRCYVSLCLVRAVTSVKTWPAAATRLGLPAATGIQIARAARRSMRATPGAMADAVSRTLSALPRDRDFRRREARVTHLADNPATWFDDWRASVTPDRQRRTLPCAIAWMWCEVAQGLLETSPACSDSPITPPRPRYHEFRGRLPHAAQVGLRTVVLDQT